MGRIAELRKKQADGSITDEETKELKELMVEAKDEAGDDAGDGDGGDDGGDDADVEAMASKIANAATARYDEVDQKLDKVLKALENGNDPELKDSPKFIVDEQLGKKSVDELSEVKINVPQRANKTHKTITGRTVMFAKALMQGDREKLQLLTEGTAADGGYLVPDEFANLIVEDRRTATVMRQIADVMTTTSDTLHLPKLDTRPKANWRSEAAVKSTSTVQFDENVFTPYSLATIVGLSQELAGDATLGVGGGGIVNYVAGLITQSLSEKEDAAFFTGSGSGQPTGIDQYTLGTLATTGAASDAADTIQKTYRRMPQGYRNNAVWVANALTWEQIDTLKDGNDQYLLRGLADSPTPVLKGRPIFEQNDIAEGTLYFGDFSFYKIVDREGIRVDVSTEATVASSSAFEKNLVFVRVEQRTDGELTLTNAIRSATGY